uniref:Putative endonuclease n=1 Tax=viral metagenome TaxID=1070528 RepID=A0A6M3JAT8_9ZZZZ
MRQVRTEGTRPEILLRRALVLEGATIRTNDPDLPGTPDVVLPALRLAVFVHGCFWHGCQAHWRPPRTRTAFWVGKVQRNRLRDARSIRWLSELGWDTLVVWEHDLPDQEEARRVARAVLRRRR